ncbi:ThiF family adenylyltransferase [candidate division WOR-3 bacterium]|nr:ThiF family adenylyltransferase [candidate division WOR-3 bacterium]
MIFQRQIAYWGEEKQKKLQDMVILQAGVGGLGGFMSQILVRAGIGKLYIVDNGVIDEPDLNRQILYKQKDIGKKKAFIASELLSSIHPYSRIVPIDKNIDEGFELPDDVKGIVDCLDNYESRIVLNNSIKNDMFFVHIAVERNYGHILTLVGGKSGKLSDLVGEFKKSDDITPVSADSVGSIASIASSEVINCIINKPGLLNTVLYIDLSDFSFRKIEL